MSTYEQMDIGIIYENQSVYILHFDNFSKEYDKELDGTLSLIEHNFRRPNGKIANERFITWKPNIKGELVKTVRPISIDLVDLKSFKRSKMTVGNFNSYMIFFMKDGTSHPMMVFRDGGTKNLMDKLENYLSITKSNKERSLFLTELRREDAVFQSFESLGMFSNTKEIQASKYSQPVSNTKEKIWSGLANIGAITNQFIRSIPNDQYSHIRDLLREDAFGIPIEGHRLNTREDQESGFEIISKPVRIELPHPSPIQRRPPLTESEWKKHLSPDGTVTCVEQLMEKIFKGGIEMSLRSTVWKYLLNFYKWDYSLEKNHEMSRRKNDIYHKLKFQWRSIFMEQEDRFTPFRERKSIIEKDMLRTDRALEFYSDEQGNLQLIYNILMSYSMYNFDLGYVQGMNDILAPILFLINDEVDAFWCFTNLMDTLEPNFTQEQLGIKKQFRQLYTLVQIFDPEFAEYLDANGCKEMLFCFRWLLVKFKRELSYENTMLLWEVLWTNYRCINFHLIFALSVLLHEKNHIMENKYGFNEILKHVNDLKLNDDLENHLCRAESLYLQLDQIWCQISEETRDILDFRLSNHSVSNIVAVQSGKAVADNPIDTMKQGFKSANFELDCRNNCDAILH